MPDPSSRSTSPAQAIAAYREALRRNAPADELARLAVPLDPEIVAWLDLFQSSRRETMRPNPGFVRRLDHVIATAPGPTSRRRRPDMLPSLRLAHADTINGREPSIPFRTAAQPRPNAPWRSAWPSSLSRLAAAVLVIALLVGAGFAALYPHFQRSDEGLPLVAPLASPTAEPPQTEERVLLDLTLSDFPPYLSEGGMQITRYPPGGSSREFTPQATEVFYIAVGPMTVTVDEAAEPLRVLAAHEPGTEASVSDLRLGEEATLETGATLVAPPGTVIELFNAGSSETTMLDLLWASTSYSTEHGFAKWERAVGWMSQDLKLPVTFLLRQVTLNPGEGLPPSASRDAAQAVAAVHAAQVANMVGETNGAVTNEGDEPLAAYVLTVFNDAGASPLASPESASPTPAIAASPEVLVDFTVTGIEPFEAEGGMAITDYPAGGSSRELAGRESPEIFYIAAGPMMMRVEEAPQPVRVIPQGTDGAIPEQTVEQGEEITLEAGSLVFLPEKAIVNLLNPGPEPTTMIDLLWATQGYSTEEGDARWVRASMPDPRQIVSPTRITLRQATIAPDEIVPGSSSDAAAVSAAAVAQEFRGEIRSTPDGEFRNDTGASIGVYVLNVESGYESPVPAANAEDSGAATLEFLWRSDGDVEDGLSRTYGLGIDPRGNVWVSDANNDRFQILAPDGTHLETWGAPGESEGEFEFYSPRSGYGAPYGDVAFDAAGNIYVADTGNFRVQKFAPDRAFLRAWGAEGEEDGQFLAPSSIAIGKNGVVYVSDEARADVQMFDADGQFLGVTATAPEGSPVYVPGGIAVDDDGNVWVADFSGSVILQYSPSGELLTSWGERGTEDGQISSPNDVVLDGRGHIFVADDGNNRLQVFTTDGQFLAKVGDEGSIETTRFADAVAVAVSADGVVYVSDNPTVQAFRFTMAGAD